MTDAGRHGPGRAPVRRALASLVLIAVPTAVLLFGAGLLVGRPLAGATVQAPGDPAPVAAELPATGAPQAVGPGQEPLPTGWRPAPEERAEPLPAVWQGALPAIAAGVVLLALGWRTLAAERARTRRARGGRA